MKKNTKVEFISLILAGVFVFFTVVISLLGVNVYKKISSRAEESYLRFTPLMLIGEKLRRSEGAAAVRIEKYGDGDALIIDGETVGGKKYYTYIYVSGGYLRQAYSALELCELGEQSGQSVCAASALSARCNDGLFFVSVTGENNQAQEICIYAP